jgi:hypothetical protein
MDFVYCLVFQNQENSILETGSVSVMKWGRETATLLGMLDDGQSPETQ